ncbi:MAG: hypothetical protein OER95_13195, partial [Acidimicrobiia bacterium]|nr:hypothetical protein [Acidimicrobiia bacterium]
MSASDRNDDLFNASHWLLDRNVSEGRGDQVAVRYRQRSYTYAEVLADTEQTAGALRAVGVVPEQRVA